MAEKKAEEAKRLRKLLEELVNSGQPRLDEQTVKEVKKICKADQDALPFTYDLLLSNLRRKHSQVRVSCLQVMDQLFVRSHAFRQLLLADLKEILELTMEPDSTGTEDASKKVARQLPPPKVAREQLKKLSLETVKAWTEKFGEGYKRLSLAYNYLRQVRKVDFSDLEARSDLQKRREEERKRRLDNVWRERVRRTREEMGERSEDMRECLVQIDACLALLVPSMEEPEGDGVVQDKDAEDVDSRQHGILSRQQDTVSIDAEALAAGPSAALSKEAEEDDVVLENLRDQHLVLVSRLIPTAKKWSATLGKAGADCGADADLLKRAIDAKRILEEARDRVEALGIDLQKKKRRKGEKEKGSVGDDSSEADDDDDNDFIEVGDKEGYEEFAVEEAAEAAAFAFDFAEPRPSTSRGDPKAASATRALSSSSTSLQEGSLSRTSSSGSGEWKLGLKEREEEEDPTTFSATIKKLRQEKHLDLSNSLSKKSFKPSSSSATSESSVPTVPFDIDLYDWGEKREPQKVLVDPEKLRFWGSSSSQAEGEMEVPGSQETRRKIDFSGRFEPVEWSCRAPLPSGKLCPRRDRVKCPLHGKIVARDATGRPSNLEDRVREDEEKERKANENPDWQDPELLKDLEAATGVNLKIPKKGERLKKKGKKHPGLISIKEETDTARKRLERKVFNRSSMKRVAATLNRLDAVKHRDKFADQFNYVFTR